MTTSSTAPDAFGAGEVVRVAGEDLLFVVMRSTSGRSICELPDTPELPFCCVPVALVLPIRSGDLRWVPLEDVTSANERGGIPP